MYSVWPNNNTLVRIYVHYTGVIVLLYSSFAGFVTCMSTEIDGKPEGHHNCEMYTVSIALPVCLE